MKTYFFTFCCCFLFCNLTDGQNLKTIDGTLGVGDYKFGASCESYNCKIDDLGWYVVYPNLSVGGQKVYKAKLAFSDGQNIYVKGVYWIEMYFESKSVENYDKIVEQLTNKYGLPTVNKEINNVKSWKGNCVTITIRREDNGEIIVVYCKKNEVKNTEF